MGQMDRAGHRVMAKAVCPTLVIPHHGRTRNLPGKPFVRVGHQITRSFSVEESLDCIISDERAYAQHLKDKEIQ